MQVAAGYCSIWRICQIRGAGYLKCVHERLFMTKLNQLCHAQFQTNHVLPSVIVHNAVDLKKDASWRQGIKCLAYEHLLALYAPIVQNLPFMTCIEADQEARLNPKHIRAMQFQQVLLHADTI